MKAPSQWIDEAIDGIRKENNITSDEQMQDALDARGDRLSRSCGRTSSAGSSAAR